MELVNTCTQFEYSKLIYLNCFVDSCYNSFITTFQSWHCSIQWSQLPLPLPQVSLPTCLNLNHGGPWFVTDLSPVDLKIIRDAGVSTISYFDMVVKCCTWKYRILVFPTYSNILVKHEYEENSNIHTLPKIQIWWENVNMLGCLVIPVENPNWRDSFCGRDAGKCKNFEIS